jgi:hypothetical protein
MLIDARVNSDYTIAIDKTYEKLLKPGMQVQIIFDNNSNYDNSEKKIALNFVVNATKNSSPGLKVKEITREWIREQ